MNIILSNQFLKRFSQRIVNYPRILAKYDQRALLFRQDPQHRSLKDHPLKGSRVEYRSFWITGDIRVIYIQIDQNTVRFIDIGSHNQVYR